MHSNQTVKMWVTKQLMLLSHPLICFCLPYIGGFKGGSDGVLDPIPPTSDIFKDILLTCSYALIPSLSVIFALAHVTICISYDRRHLPHPQPSNLDTIG